jgi:hypothetical protein
MMKLRLAVSRTHRRHQSHTRSRLHRGERRSAANRRARARARTRVVRRRAKKMPILADTAKVIADPLVRNQATVGGNLAHGDPANDHPATMLALGAEVSLRPGLAANARSGAKTSSPGLFTTALAPGEILTEIRIPVPPPRSGGAYSSSNERSATSRRPRRRADHARRPGACKRAGIGADERRPTPSVTVNGVEHKAEVEPRCCSSTSCARTCG